MFIVSTRKISLFLFFSTFCGAIVFITATELFSQRGMSVTVRTEDGEEFALYKDSYALVVGNGDYLTKNGWNPLPGAVNDVKEIAEVLKRHGFNVTVKIDVTKAEFNKAFSDFIYKSGKDKDNRLLFYYAGHGYTTKSATGEDLGYLVMLDTPNPTNAGEFDLHSVDMVKFVSDSKKIHAKHVLFMFDSCFSGTVLNLRNRVTPSHITDRIKNPVRQFITAGRADEPVPDRSEFKKAFLNLLEGRVEEPTPDGYLTGIELGDYLYRTVPKFSQGQHPQHGKIHDQQLNTGDFVFVLPQNRQDGNGDSGIELDTIATLNIISTPEGATVYVDSTIIGTTPIQGYQIDTGIRLEKQVNVGLELLGYKSRVKKIMLKGGQQFPWDVHLEEMEKEPVPPKLEPDPSLSGLMDDIQIDEEAASYLSLVSDNSDTLVPINSMQEWAGWAEWAVVQYNDASGVWEKTKNGQLPEKPYGFVENQYVNLFDHWIYSHAESKIVYDISNGDYAKFDGYFVMPNPCGDIASVELIFLADDVEVYNSGLIIASKQKESHISFHIPAGAQTLTMRVTDGGDSNGCDHWILGNARLLQTRQPIPSKLKPSVPQTIIENDFTLNEKARSPSPNIPQTILGKDGAPMVLIPAGEFQMGSAPGTVYTSATTPAHTVYVEAFYMDVHEVTVGQYNQFVHETGHRPLPADVSTYSPADRHPVVAVSWHDAMAYAKWAGKRLPTEAEWEKAARGGLVGKQHPWDNAPPDGTQCNFADENLGKVWKKRWGDNHAEENINDGYAYTAPVGSYPPNGYGLYDMAGNVEEWCFDAYDENFYANSPRKNPIAEILIRDEENNIIEVNKKRVVRGGSWYYSLGAIWIAYRANYIPNHAVNTVGFRCVKSVTP